MGWESTGEQGGKDSDFEAEAETLLGIEFYGRNDEEVLQQTWRESLIFMSESGVKNFIEIGPGKALTGMVKRTIKDANCFSINTITDIKNLINEFKK